MIKSCYHMLLKHKHLLLLFWTTLSQCVNCTIPRGVPVEQHSALQDSRAPDRSKARDESAMSAGDIHQPSMIQLKPPLELS